MSTESIIHVRRFKTNGSCYQTLNARSLKIPPAIMQPIELAVIRLIGGQSSRHNFDFEKKLLT